MLKRILLTILVILFALSPIFCVAEDACVSTRQLAVKVSNNLGHGSGVKIKQGILTAEHVVEDNFEVFVTDHKKIKLPGYVIKKNKEIDLALVAPLYKNEQYINIAEDTPELGDRLFSIGCGAGRFLVAKVGCVSDFDSPYIITSYPFFPGDSGGPVINEDGELVGIVSAYEFRVDELGVFPTYGRAIDLNSIKDFLRE